MENIIGKYSFDWERYLNNIEMLSVKKKKGITYKLFAEPMIKGTRIEYCIKHKYGDQILDYLNKNSLDLSWLKEIKQIEIIPSNIPIFFERGELFDLCLHLLSETSHGSLLSGFSISSNQMPFNLFKLDNKVLQQIAETLNQVEKQFLNFIDEKEMMISNLIDKEFENINGYSISHNTRIWIKYLWTCSNRQSLKDHILKCIEYIHPIGARLRKSTFVDSVASNDPILLRNITYSWADFVHLCSIYLAYARPVREATKLLYDKDFELKIADVFGEAKLNEIKRDLFDLSGRWNYPSLLGY